MIAVTLHDVPVNNLSVQVGILYSYCADSLYADLARDQGLCY